MKTLNLQYLIFFFISLVLSVAKAELTAESDYLYGVDSVTYDSQTNLLWLDMNLSDGRSFNDVDLQFQLGGDFEGFRHATRDEVFTLLQHAGIDTIPSNSIENFPVVTNLISLLGTTTSAGVVGVTSSVSSSGNNFTVFAILSGSSGDVGTSTTDPSSPNFAAGNWLVKSGALKSIDDGEFGSDSLTLDRISNHEWLDLSFTDGRSYLDVSSQLGPGGEFEGFRYATKDEVLALFTNAGIPLVPGSSTGNLVPVNNLHRFVGTTDNDGTFVLGITASPRISVADSQETVYAQISGSHGVVDSSFTSQTSTNFASGSWLVKSNLESEDHAVFGPGSLTVDKITNLSWLNLSFTDGRSFSDVSSRFANGEEFDGFRYATEEEVLALFQHAVIPDVPGSSIANVGPISLLQKYLGTSYVDPTDTSKALALGITATPHPTIANHQVTAYAYLTNGNGEIATSSSDRSGVNFASASWLVFDPQTGPPPSDIDADGIPDLDDPCPADPDNLCNTAGSGAGEVTAGDGGIVSSGDGSISLEADAGDLADDTVISITAASTQEADVILSTGAGEPLASYSLEPDGLEFNNPITLTLSFDVTGLDSASRDALDIYRLDGDSDGDGVLDTYTPLGAVCTFAEDLAEMTVTASCSVELDHFSDYAVIVPLDSDGDGIFDDFNGVIDICADENATGFDVDDDGCIDSFSGLLDLLTRLVTEGVIDSKMQNSLFSKVENANQSATRENICDAVDQLGAFENQVRAQMGKKIEIAAADLVTQYAASVADFLNSQLPEGVDCSI